MTSPYVRARETADIAAEILKAPIKETRRLLPSVEPQKIWEELSEHADIPHIILTGHEPHMSKLAGFLLMTVLPVDFKKGGLMRIQVENPPAQPQGVLKWLLTPKMVSPLK